ncbi:hypothetical protein [Polaribacter sargassicola]|uniref:hypothetical protein n=1 Tax=Polaribacter sargassicola TaxID=2836891 RepID=UPI001F3506CC|nr:hypothetical protein [Polaribacter sp. DS7-9]MCG1036193.1 hypothetical protein [Polaribacter sp. DS7-9]
MKKLVLTVAVVLLTSSVSVFAQSNNNPKEIASVIVKEEFKEITIKEMPESVANAILKDFPKGAVTKVYVNESEQYKIAITVEETEKILYADKEGNWLKKEDIITSTIE